MHTVRGLTDGLSCCDRSATKNRCNYCTTVVTAGLSLLGAVRNITHLKTLKCALKDQ